MKRKLFTLLAAFMVLAAFQVDAQTKPYDGKTPHWLNIWKANYAGGFTDPTSSPINAAESAEDYPISGDGYTAVNGTATSTQSIIKTDAGRFTRQSQRGALGQLESYFYLTSVGGNPNLYQIKAKNGTPFTFDANEGSKAGQKISNFEFVRFYDAGGNEYAAPLTGPVVGFIPEKSQSVPAQMGGYLSAESNATGTNDRTRYVLVFNVTLNANNLPVNEYAMVSMDSIRRNWSNIAAGKLPVAQRLVPVWVRADQIGGRWANINDFNKVGEFIKFQIGSTNDTLAVNDGSAKVNTFSVRQVGELSFQGGSRPAGVASDPDQSELNVYGAHASNFGDNGVVGGITKRLTYNTTTTTWGLQYFSIGDPKTGKVVSVAKQNAIQTGMVQGAGVFGDFLEMKDPYTTSVQADIRTQQFAVWIGDTGEMELYPLNAYTCDYPTHKFDVTTPSSPGYNAAVWNDSPKVNSSTPNNNPTGTPGLPTTQDLINASFKLGKYNQTGDKVLSLTDNYNTAYSDLLLNPHPADMINKIQTGRYFFIEATPKDEIWAYTGASTIGEKMKDKTYVLDVVRQWNAKEMKMVKRVVLTAKERNRYAGTEGRYFDTPYDSVNMSAHWRVDPVYSKTYDPTTPNNHLIGYRFINELGDVLEYNYNCENPVPATGDGGAPYAGSIQAWTPAEAIPYTNWYSCIAYLRKDMNASYYSNGTTATAVDLLIPQAVGTDVWQSVHFSNDGYFKLRNLQWANAENDFRMPKNAGGTIYMDTIRDFGYVDPAANPASSYYWHTGLRGRAAGNPEKKQWEKDVWAIGSLQNAMMLKLTDIEYEYAKGGNNDNKTNHTNDGYFEDDSLCTYLHKDGEYDIVEALSNVLRLESGYTGPDQTYGKNLAYMTTSTSTTPWLTVEPVDTTEYITPMYYTVSGVDQLNVDYRMDNYKWHYIKNKAGEYLIYDIINTTTNIVEQQYGFKFKAVDKTNATAFRFYQPLVGDKHLENYIMEFRVPSHVYDVTRQTANPFATVVPTLDKQYANDNYGINKDVTVYFEREQGDLGVLVGAADATSHAYLANANNPQSTSYTALTAAVKYYVNNKIPFSAWNPTTLQAYKDYLHYEHAARTKYAVLTTGSDLLLSTWNDGRNKVTGASTPATRFKFRGEDESLCKRDYVHSQYLLNNGMYALPVGAEEWNVRESVGSGDYMTKDSKDYTVDAASKTSTITVTLADTLRVGSATSTVNGESFKYGYINRYGSYASSARGANDLYRLYKNTKEVELYYVQNAEGKYLTIDTTSVYAQSIPSTITGVSGTRLRWADKYTATSNKYSSVGEKADYQPLQMFAIYGCESAQAPYGTFIFIPACAWEVNYLAPYQQVKIAQNQNIGNGTVTDEFRIGVYGKNSQLVVQPSSTTYNQGIVPTEYMFTRSQYYNGNFCHHNFIQDANNSYLASYGTVAKSYSDPSQHWTVEKKTDANGKAIDYTYVFSVEAQVDGDGIPVAARTQLKNEYYLIPQDSSLTSFGGKVQKFTAINVSAPQDIKTITITCITEKAGDACISKFKKFDADDLTYDWGIIESIYKDRYVYSRGLASGTGYNVRGSADAYLAQDPTAATTEGVEFLRLRASNTTTYAEHHGIPYYNIIHVTRDNKGNEVLHYLEMTKDSVKFRLLTPREAYVLENYNQFPDTLQKMKFCFPFAKDGNKLDSATYENGSKYANLMIRTMPEASTVQYLAIDKNNTSRVYADASIGGVFFFGPNAAGDDEWVGAASKTGWLKDLNSSVKSPYVLTPSAATPVNYGKLNYYGDIQPSIDAAKYEFVLIYQDVVGKYNPKPIWYYKIRVKGDDGKYKYLTTSIDSTHNADYVWQGNYTYAYFTDEFAERDPNHQNADKNYSQTFGLKYNRSAMTTDHPFPFWVVAQVPSGAYKYLAQFNSRMVFINAGTESKAQAENNAMTFEVGSIDGSGTFTDNPTLDANTVKIYGQTGSVKVVNAKGAIELYTIDGRMFKTVTANSTEETIAAPRGVVIVKNGANVAKVFVK